MYWGNRAKTRETFEGRWTKSGDKYIRNADGTFTYAGRSDDMLKVGGMWVSPFEVEATLVQHPAVLEAAVIGIADADGLIKTKAFVVLKEGEPPTSRLQGLRQGRARAVQVSALNRVHRRTAEDRDRQDPALQASRAGKGHGEWLSYAADVIARSDRASKDARLSTGYCDAAIQGHRFRPSSLDRFAKGRDDELLVFAFVLPQLSELRTTNPSPDRVLASAG